MNQIIELAWKRLSIRERKDLLEKLFASKLWRRNRKEKIGGTFRQLAVCKVADNLPPEVWTKLYYATTEEGTFSVAERTKTVNRILACL